MPLPNTPLFAAVKSAFETIIKLPYCSGTVPLDVNSATLFYRSGDGSGFVNFMDATEAQLASLAKACQPATFGVQQKDVLDESYRKAGKMDAADFSMQFSPITSRILDTVRDALLQRSDDAEAIRMELYKLNVYGPGSFFKSHVDTPRSDMMFGSLVVIYLLSMKEALSSCATVVKNIHSTPHLPSCLRNHPLSLLLLSTVTSSMKSLLSPRGYRVTLTYNLYYAKQPSPRAALGIIPDQDPLEGMKKALSALLDDPEFLPEGGLIGFGLSHKYPFNVRTTELDFLITRLKGSDADILEICNSLSLDVSLKALYSDKTRWSSASRYCLLDFFADLENQEIEMDIVDHMKDTFDGTLIYDVGNPGSHDDEAEPIVWIKPLNNSNKFQQPFIAYGNEAILGHA